MITTGFSASQASTMKIPRLFFYKAVTRQLKIPVHDLDVTVTPMLCPGILDTTAAVPTRGIWEFFKIAPWES